MSFASGRPQIITLIFRVTTSRSSVGQLSKRIILLEMDRQVMRKSMDDLRQELRGLAKGLEIRGDGDADLTLNVSCSHIPSAFYRSTNRPCFPKC